MPKKASVSFSLLAAFRPTNPISPATGRMIKGSDGDPDICPAHGREEAIDKYASEKD